MRSILDAVRAPTYSPNGVRKPVLTPARLTALANLGGCALISYGIGMIAVEAGLIAAGVLLIVLGKAASLPTLSSLR
jgi:hypothetical protein